MKNFPSTSFLCVAGAAAILLPPSHAAGQTTVATAPVGYLQTSCLSNSDTLVAPPFTRSAAFTGSVASISGNVVTVNSTSLSADAYDAPTTTPATKDTYYLSIGPATATLAGTLSVTSGSPTVTGTGTTFGTDVKAGDRITINDGVNLLTYTVTAIASTTSLTIDRAFSDSAATGTTSAVAPMAAVTKTAAKTTGKVVTTMVATPKTQAVTSAATLGGLSATYDHSPYEGRTYQVASNGTATVTVNLNGDTLASVAAGTQVSIIPYWTLNSVLPAANAGVSFTASPSSLSRRTQILIPNYSGSGTDLATMGPYYFNSSSSNTGWRLYGDAPTTEHGYDPLLPDGYMIVRNGSDCPTLPITFSGSVPTNKQSVPLMTLTSGAQDNEVSLARPANVTLNNLGLTPNDNSFRASPSSLSRVDQLFVYDNTQAAIDKGPASIYYYLNSNGNTGWRLYGDDPTVDHGTDVVVAGNALTIRKAAATGTAQNPVWTNSPNY